MLGFGWGWGTCSGMRSWVGVGVVGFVFAGGVGFFRRGGRWRDEESRGVGGGG